jgi:hypothetical protein
VVAPAEELDAMAEHFEAVTRRDLAIERVVDRFRQVEDSVAPDAREMMVLRHIAVEPAPARAGPLDHQPRLDEEAQVPVDGCQAHPGHPAAHAPEDPLRRRVQVRRPDTLEDEPARVCGPEAPAQRAWRIVPGEAISAPIVPPALLENDSHFWIGQ